MFANAAVLGPVTPIAHIDPRAWDATVALNLTANFRLIRSLHPLLLVGRQFRVALRDAAPFGFALGVPAIPFRSERSEELLLSR